VVATWTTTWTRAELLEAADNDEQVDLPNVVSLAERMRNRCKHFAFQWEVAPGTGMLHLQIYGYAPEALSMRTWREIISPRAYIEVMKGMPWTAHKYCTKQETRLEWDADELLVVRDLDQQGLFLRFDENPPKYPKAAAPLPVLRAVVDPLEDLVNRGGKLYTYQQQLLAEVSVPCSTTSRTITWLYEPNGNVGKSALIKAICMRYKALFVQGAGDNIKYAVTQWVNGNPDKKIAPRELEICLFDIPRSSMGAVSYNALEGIANGLLFNGKYESGMCTFNRPHVVIVANEPPAWDQLSKDRWDVRKITEIMVGSGNPTRDFAFQAEAPPPPAVYNPEGGAAGGMIPYPMFRQYTHGIRKH